MRAETEFDVNDEVFIIDNGEIIETSVEKIEIKCSNDGVSPRGTKIETYYWLRRGRVWMKDFRMFRTREGVAERWLEDNGLKTGVSNVTR